MTKILPKKRSHSLASLLSFFAMTTYSPEASACSQDQGCIGAVEEAGDYCASSRYSISPFEEGTLHEGTASAAVALHKHFGLVPNIVIRNVHGETEVTESVRLYEELTPQALISPGFLMQFPVELHAKELGFHLTPYLGPVAHIGNYSLNSTEYIGPGSNPEQRSQTRLDSPVNKHQLRIQSGLQLRIHAESEYKHEHTEDHAAPKPSLMFGLDMTVPLVGDYVPELGDKTTLAFSTALSVPITDHFTAGVSYNLEGFVGPAEVPPQLHDSRLYGNIALSFDGKGTSSIAFTVGAGSRWHSEIAMPGEDVEVETAFTGFLGVTYLK